MAYITAIDTLSLSNQDISSALLVHTMTNTTRVRKIWLAIELDQIVGVGDYVVYATIQRGGSGAHFRVSGEAITASGGVTSLMFSSFAVILNVSDVLKIYVVGQSGDTTAPDISTRVWEEMSGNVDAADIRAAIGMAAANLDTQLAGVVSDTEDIQARIPAALVGGRIDAALSAAGLATDAGEEIADAVRSELAVELAHLDADVSTAGGGLTAQETRDAMKLAPTTGTPAAGSVDAHLDAIQAQTDAIDDIKAVTDSLDVTAVSHVTASNAGEITIKRTLNLAAVVSGLTIPADWTACYWTVKRSTDDLDADAIIQILESNPGDADDGVQVLMGVALTDESDGSLTVNQAGGTVAIALGDASTALLEDAVELVWDVKFHYPAGKVEPGAGTATITTAVTRA